MKSPIFALKRYGELRVSTVAGAWVFYFLTALLPLLFLLITAFAVFGVNLTAELVESLPKEFKQAGAEIIDAAENASRGVTAFFVISVFLSGSALLNQMRKDAEYIYGIKANGGFMQRVWAVIALGVLFATFLGAAFLIAFERTVLSVFPIAIRSVWVKTGVFATIITAGFFLNVMLNAFVSPVKISFADACVGGVVALSVTVTGTIGFIAYLRLFNPYNPFYGGLTTAIVFLFWTYILMLGQTFGVVASKRSYFKRKKKERSKERSENAEKDAVERTRKPRGALPAARA
ncbi:MAG: YihY/virulence factor BrkB family protein [Clostridia bacterium]|nr:YihY/virulence factor BrkB family protein [Clostridia bacterium]